MAETPRAFVPLRPVEHRVPIPGRNLAELALLWIAYGAMVAGNVWSELGRLNGVTAADVSNEVFSWFAPAGYVFSIWGVIYAALALWLVRLTMNHAGGRDAPQRWTAQGGAFILSCALNLAWIGAWHYRLYVISLVIIAALLACVATLYSNARRWATNLLDWAPLSLYFSWLVVATLANTAHVVTVAAPEIPQVAWMVATFGLLAFVLAIAAAMNRSFDDPVFGLVTLWAGVGLGVRLLSVSLPLGIAVFAACGLGALAIYLPREPQPAVQTARR